LLVTTAGDELLDHRLAGAGDRDGPLKEVGQLAAR
jgi:hypothetical protein